MVVGSLGMFVQYLLAHKQVAYLRGPSAVKLCPICMNVVNHDTVLLPGATVYLIPSTRLDVHRYQLHSDESVRALLRRLADEARHTPQRLDELERLFGYNFCLDNLFLDAHLNVGLMSVLTFDRMHVFFVGGVYCKELEEFLERCNGGGLGGVAMDAYLNAWVWPRCIAGAQGLCKLRGASHAPSGSASEHLSSAVVVRKWVEDVVSPSGVCPAEAASMIALCNVIALLPLAQNGEVTPIELEQAQLNHLGLHLVAYGDTVWTPKFHMSLHLAPALRRHGCLPSCFVQERYHRIPKRFMQGRTNLRGYARGLRQGVTVQKLYEVTDPTTRASLTHQIAANGKERAAMLAFGAASRHDAVTTSPLAIVRGNNIARNDVVLFREAGRALEVGQVVFHALTKGTCYSCVVVWPVLERPGDIWLNALRTDTGRLIRTESISSAVVSANVDVDNVSTLLIP